MTIDRAVDFSGENILREYADPKIFMKVGSHVFAIPIKPKDELHVPKPKQQSKETEL